MKNYFLFLYVAISLVMLMFIPGVLNSFGSLSTLTISVVIVFSTIAWTLIVVLAVCEDKEVSWRVGITEYIRWISCSIILHVLVLVAVLLTWNNNVWTCSLLVGYVPVCIVMARVLGKNSKRKTSMFSVHGVIDQD